MTLNFVKPDFDLVHMNVLLYGPAKTRKSTGAASAPGPVLYVNADRPNSTRFLHELYGEKIKEVKFEGLDTMIDVGNDVKDHPGKWGSVVLDPIGDLYRITIEKMSGRAVRPNRDFYGDTGTYLERFCRELCEQPLNAIFVAHRNLVKNDASGDVEVLPQTGTQNPKLGQALMAMVDVFGHTGVVTPEEEDAEPQGLVQLYDGHGRYGGTRWSVLGRTPEVNISAWIDKIAALPKPTDAEEKPPQRGRKKS